LARLFTGLLTIDWAFFEERPKRLNELIAPYVEKLQHQKAEELVDQIVELEMYADAVAEQNAAIE
jgi:hypothetical protein